MPSPAAADHVTNRRDRKAKRRDDVVLAIDDDAEAADREARPDEDAARKRLLDRRRGQQPGKLHRGGHSRPARSTSISLSRAASPTTQARTGPPCVRTPSIASSNLPSLLVVTATAAPTSVGRPASELGLG